MKLLSVKGIALGLGILAMGLASSSFAWRGGHGGYHHGGYHHGYYHHGYGYHHGYYHRNGVYRAGYGYGYYRGGVWVPAAGAAVVTGAAVGAASCVRYRCNYVVVNGMRVKQCGNQRVC